MKRIAAFFILLYAGFYCLQQAPSHAAGWWPLVNSVIRLTQHNIGADGTAASSTTVALTGSVVLNKGFVVGIVQWADPGTVTVTVADDKGNTYNVVDRVFDASNFQSSASFWLNNITNGPSTITATLSTTEPFRRILWAEFSKIDTSGTPTDPSGAGGHTAQVLPGSTSTDAMTSGTITPTVNGNLIWSGFTGGGSTWTKGTNFTAIDISSGAVNTAMGAQYLIQGTAAAIAGTWTEDIATAGIMSVISFKKSP